MTPVSRKRRKTHEKDPDGSAVLPALPVGRRLRPRPAAGRRPAVRKQRADRTGRDGPHGGASCAGNDRGADDHDDHRGPDESPHDKGTDHQSAHHQGGLVRHGDGARRGIRPARAGPAQRRAGEGRADRADDGKRAADGCGRTACQGADGQVRSHPPERRALLHGSGRDGRALHVLRREHRLRTENARKGL